MTSIKIYTSQHRRHYGEEAIQPDSSETICPTRLLTRLSAMIWNKYSC